MGLPQSRQGYHGALGWGWGVLSGSYSLSSALSFSSLPYIFSDPDQGQIVYYPVAGGGGVSLRVRSPQPSPSWCSASTLGVMEGALYDYMDRHILAGAGAASSEAVPGHCTESFLFQPFAVG